MIHFALGILAGIALCAFADYMQRQQRRKMWMQYLEWEKRRASRR